MPSINQTDRDIYRQALNDMVASLRGQGEHVAADVVARNIDRVIPRTLEECTLTERHAKAVKIALDAVDEASRVRSSIWSILSRLNAMRLRYNLYGSLPKWFREQIDMMLDLTPTASHSSAWVMWAALRPFLGRANTPGFEEAPRDEATIVFVKDVRDLIAAFNTLPPPLESRAMQSAIHWLHQIERRKVEKPHESLVSIMQADVEAMCRELLGRKP